MIFILKDWMIISHIFTALLLRNRITISCLLLKSIFVSRYLRTLALLIHLSQFHIISVSNHDFCTSWQDFSYFSPFFPLELNKFQNDFIFRSSELHSFLKIRLSRWGVLWDRKTSSSCLKTIRKHRIMSILILLDRFGFDAHRTNRLDCAFSHVTNLIDIELEHTKGYFFKLSGLIFGEGSVFFWSYFKQIVIYINY